MQCLESDRTMIIEKILIETDSEDGNHLTVTGRSLESILDRRIIWGLLTVSGNLQTAIKTMLNECIISPSDTNRKISNFIFEESTDSSITELTIDAQYTGDNLLDVIEDICSERSIGFKVLLNSSNQFVFSLYAGTDRSYDQVSNPYVIFSPKFDDLDNSNYLESKASLKTVTLIGGEGEGSERKYASIQSSTETGLNRRELFTDARDISSNTDDNTTLTDSEYTALLQQRGAEKLAECTEVTSFEGEADVASMFRYGESFTIGDVVQIENEYSHEGKARVMEMVISDDTSGSSVYPTFSMVSE